MKKGFTLIELLAVIVILAIIAVIAVPIVLNIIEDSKKNASLRSADFYLDAVEMSIANRTMKHGAIPNDAYPIMSDGNICLSVYDKEKQECGGESKDDINNKNVLKVEVKGDKPTEGKVAIEKGQIVKELSTDATKKTELVLNKQTIVKNSKGELVYQEITEPVKLCTANTTTAKALVWQGNGDPASKTSYAEEEVGLLASTDGAYAPGVAYTCNFIDDSETNNMTFFILSDAEDTVTLIAGTNLGGAVDWSEDGNNHKDESEDSQAVTAKAAIAEGTSNWSSANGGKLSEEQMLTIKLPTAYQIAEAVGQTFSGSSIGGLPTWLTSHSNDLSVGGYWTSAPYASDSTHAWAVYSIGSLYEYGLVAGSWYGVRPVITISKSNI